MFVAASREFLIPLGGTGIIEFKVLAASRDVTEEGWPLSISGASPIATSDVVTVCSDCLMH